MNNHQTTVLWIGLILIVLNLVRWWPEIKATLGSGTPSSGSSGPPGIGSQIPVPFLPPNWMGYGAPNKPVSHKHIPTVVI